MRRKASRAASTGAPSAPRIALVTARAALALDTDMPLLVEALGLAGAEAQTPSWDDGSVDWSAYDVAVLRSTWDYVDRIDEFLSWCEECSRHTRLVNPPKVVRWNTDKHYLRGLERAGVPVVPTRFVEPGGEAGESLERFLAGKTDSVTVGRPCDFEDFVVKPAVGAGSRDAARYRRAEAAMAAGHVARLLDAGRAVMLQPYLSQVDHHGETAVLYLGGGFSHSIRKGPLLRAGAGLVEGLFAPEDITARIADEAELAVAAAAYRALPFVAPPYARIDLLRDGKGLPVVLELELTEPSLFLDQDPRAAKRFADWIVASVATDGGQPGRG
jgi:glutathione synthase/RimK-type ligase-like ATP-grasp enzyme